MAADPTRDQSYFLFSTTLEQMDYLRFPLGDLPKDEVRELARRYELVTADKPDSQDICFVPNGNYASIVERLRPEAGEPGDIVDLSGAVLGRHKGIIHYTIGQRRGLGIGGRAGVGEDETVLYVVRIEADTHRVVVGPRSALAVSQVPGQRHKLAGRGRRPTGQRHGNHRQAALDPRSPGGAPL